MDHLTKKQKNIYTGLLSIGQEIAAFYLDGTVVIGSDLKTKSYLLGHLLREIDGGLRNIFEQPDKKQAYKENISEEQLLVLFEKIKDDYEEYEYLPNLTFKEFKEKGHISSILASFNISIDSPTAVKYFKLARWLNKYAHRSGAFNSPRNPEDVIKIWHEFEEVLDILIGNYYSLSTRLDTIISIDKPSNEILSTLPNLLNLETRYTYFFRNLKNTGWLEPLYKEGYFKGEKNPELVELENKPGSFSIPNWSALNYLEKVTQFNLTEQNEEISGLLAHIINEIDTYRLHNGSRIDNEYTDHSLFKIICSLPKEYITESHFEFIRNSLKKYSNNFFGYSLIDFLNHIIFLKDKPLLLRAVELLFDYTYESNQFFKKFDSILPDYELSRIISIIKNDLQQLLGDELLVMLLAKMDNIIATDNDSFIKYRIPTIDNHKQTNSPEQIENQIVYLVRDILDNLNEGDCLRLSSLFKKKEHPIYSRICLNQIGKRYKLFKDLFWSRNNNPLNNKTIKHELYELFLNNYSDFTAQEFERIISWIKDLDYYNIDDFKDKEDLYLRYTAYKKKEWLTSLLPSKNPSVVNLYEELNQINDAEVEHPGFDSWSTTQAGNISPIKKEEIVSMSLQEIINYQREFLKKPEPFIGPNIEGFLDAFTEIIRENPNKFEEEYTFLNFENISIVSSWMKGILLSWEQSKEVFRTEKIFKTINVLILETELWDSNNEKSSYSRSFISRLLSFLEIGMRNDAQAFEKEILPEIKVIIFSILDNDKSEIHDFQNLAMTVLNNSKGKLYSVLLQYSLRCARIEKKDDEKWDENIKNYFTNQVNNKNTNPLLFYVIGQFLPNILFLDSNWVDQRIELIFPKENIDNWLASMSGFHAYHSSFNKTIFELLTKGGHYLKAIESEKLTSSDQSQILKIICFAHLNGNELVPLDSPLVVNLITTKSSNLRQILVRTLWNPEFRMTNSTKAQLKTLWSNIFERSISLKEPELDKIFLSGCCLWSETVGLDEKTVDILYQSVSYIQGRDYSWLINILNGFANEHPKNVGKILLNMFKHKLDYTHYLTELSQTVKVLYEKGEKEVADNICLLHGERGIDGLKHVYFDNNSL